MGLLHCQLSWEIHQVIGPPYTNEPQKKTAAGYFPLNPGCFIGILTLVYYSCHITMVFSLLKWETMESKENLIFTIHPLVPSFSGIFYHLPATEKKQKQPAFNNDWSSIIGMDLSFAAWGNFCTSSSFHQGISSFLMDRCKGKWFFNHLRRGLKHHPPHIYETTPRFRGNIEKLWDVFRSKVSEKPLTVSTWWLNHVEPTHLKNII